MTDASLKGICRSCSLRDSTNLGHSQNRPVPPVHMPFSAAATGHPALSPMESGVSPHNKTILDFLSMSSHSFLSGLSTSFVY